MSATKIDGEIRYDPYDTELQLDPFPMFRRMREEAPLYYNEEYDFFALSRFADVEDAFKDHQSFSSAKSDILELIKTPMELPSGVFIFEDPPLHTAHRGILSRVFTPKKMLALEPQIREYCARVLDPLVGTDRLDFVADLGARMPMKVIGMLLGIPEEDQEDVRVHQDNKLRREEGQPGTFDDDQFADGTFFERLVDERLERPADDLMSALIQAEFEDETGTTRRLTRDEILIFLNILATAGNETTEPGDRVERQDPRRPPRPATPVGRGPLAHPERGRGDPPLPAACPPVVPVRDPRRRAPRADRSRGQRPDAHHGVGQPRRSGVPARRRRVRRHPLDQPPHHLRVRHPLLPRRRARRASRRGIAIEEILSRFPEWEVDMGEAKLDNSQVRGWASLPVHLPTA